MKKSNLLKTTTRSTIKINLRNPERMYLLNVIIYFNVCVGKQKSKNTKEFSKVEENRRLASLDAKSYKSFSSNKNVSAKNKLLSGM